MWRLWSGLRRRFAVLCYHEVSSVPAKWAVSPATFATHLEWLRELSFTPVSMGQVLAELSGGPRLPPRAVCLHFDDARAGVSDTALRVLREAGVSATIYAVPAWMDGRVAVPATEQYGGVMTWEQLREAAADPLVEVGCHGDSHRNLRRLPRSALQGEIGDAKRRLEDRLGREVAHFAPPYNRVNARVRKAVRRAGYRTLSAGGGRVNGYFCSPYRVRRFLVAAGFSRAKLLRIASQLGPSAEST